MCYILHLQEGDGKPFEPQPEKFDTEKEAVAQGQVKITNSVFTSFAVWKHCGTWTIRPAIQKID